jgi:hypothetical protein
MLTLSRLFISLAFLCANVVFADDAGLGVASGLSGEVENSAVTLPKQPVVNVPHGVRPVIILPPEEYQPHTLVVPLPNEKSPPVLLRRDSVEVLQQNQPAMPKSGIRQYDEYDQSEGQGEVVKTRPLVPVVY